MNQESPEREWETRSEMLPAEAEGAPGRGEPRAKRGCVRAVASLLGRMAEMVLCVVIGCAAWWWLEGNVLPRRGPRAGDTKTILLPGGAPMEMVWCPPGTFKMGPGLSKRKVTLTRGFWIAKTEVTQSQWQSVMGTNPSQIRGNSLPVVNVNWNDCAEFCRRAGFGMQLPTEAQWEYACRAGKKTSLANSGDWRELGWYSGNSGCYLDESGAYAFIAGGRIQPVGQKAGNEWGLYDMLGNASEWCADWMGDYRRGSKDPTGPDSGDTRVVRGGDWRSSSLQGFAGFRDSSVPAHSDDTIGFRPVLVVP